MATRGTRGVRSGGGGIGTGGTTYSDILAKITQQKESAKAANLQRYDQAMQIYDEIISRYRPGGQFGEAALGQLEQRKVRDVGKETQQLISSGLYGTTTMGATGRRWEETVGAPERLRLEDIQMQRLSQAQVGKAGFMERREDVGPDPSLVAQLSQQVGAGAGIPQAGAQGTYDEGPSPWDPEYMGGGWSIGTLGAAKPVSPAIPGGGTPTPGGGYSAEYYKQKRLADEAKAQKLAAEGKLSYGEGGYTFDPWKAYADPGEGPTHYRSRYKNGKPAGYETKGQTTGTYKPPKYSTGYGSPTGKF